MGKLGRLLKILCALALAYSGSVQAGAGAGAIFRFAWFPPIKASVVVEARQNVWETYPGVTGCGLVYDTTANTHPLGVEVLVAYGIGAYQGTPELRVYDWSVDSYVGNPIALPRGSCEAIDGTVSWRSETRRIGSRTWNNRVAVYDQCRVAWRTIWKSPPIRADPGWVNRVRNGYHRTYWGPIREVFGDVHGWAKGPLRSWVSATFIQDGKLRLDLLAESKYIRLYVPTVEPIDYQNYWRLQCR